MSSPPKAQLLFGQLRLEPARPAIDLGLRGALAIWLPICLGMLAHNLLDGILAAFAAFSVIVCDVGGAYRTKALAMVSAVFANTSAIFVATWLNPNPELRVVATFVWVFCAGFANIFGNAAAIVAFNSAVIFTTSVEIPNPPDAWHRAVIYLVGGAWTLFLSLGLWPLRSHKPIFDAVKETYERLSRMMALVALELEKPDPDRAGSRLNAAYEAVITQIDIARNVWTVTRAQRSGQSKRGIQLLVLLEDASLIANKILSLSQTLYVVSAEPGFSGLKETVEHAARQLRNAFHLLALIIHKRGESIHLKSLLDALGRLSISLSSDRNRLNDDDFSSPENVRNFLRQFESLIGKLRDDARIASGLEHGSRSADLSEIIPQETPQIWSVIVNNLNFNSLGFRHASRLSLVAALAVTLNLVANLPRGYWSVLTALVVLKPNFGGTITTGVQRITGTVLGALIAALLGSTIRNQPTLLFCAGLFAFAALAFRPFNYALFVTGLTPMVTLILNIGDVGDWRLAMLRVLETLIGGSLALLGGFVLFPMWERRKLPVQLSKTLRANRDYFQSIIGTVLKRTVDLKKLGGARRAAALENSNASAALQRALVEPSRDPEDIEPAMVFGVYIRSFFSTATMLVDHAAEFQDPNLSFVLEGVGEASTYLLNNLLEVLEDDGPLKPLPELGDGLLLFRYAENLESMSELERPLAYLTLDRLIDNLKAMHSAVARLPVQKWGDQATYRGGAGNRNPESRIQNSE
jgi:uncharacterized membrane protein YccC